MHFFATHERAQPRARLSRAEQNVAVGHVRGDVGGLPAGSAAAKREGEAGLALGPDVRREVDPPPAGLVGLGGTRLHAHSRVHQRHRLAGRGAPEDDGRLGRGGHQDHVVREEARGLDRGAGTGGREGRREGELEGYSGGVREHRAALQGGPS